jgi:ABC-type Fe3+ transport system substrate-binding protein
VTVSNKELDTLVEAVRSETGTLHLEWPLGITESLDEWQDAFNEMFGLDIVVDYESYLESTPTMMKFVAAVEANAPATTDVFLGPFAHFLHGGPQGQDLFQPARWDLLAPEWPASVVAPDGRSVAAYQQLVGFAYNTELLDETAVPRTAAEVLDLAASRPVASTLGAACFPFLASNDVLGREALLAHLRAFAPLKAGLINPADVDSIAQGDYVGVWLSPANNFVDRARAGGAPVAAVVVRDAAVTISWDMAVAQTATNPNTATLWIYFMNTPTAQEISYRNTFADNRFLEGSQVAKIVDGHEAEGIRFVHFDNRYGLDHPEAYSSELRREVIDALGT